jgi:hypothetical protein
MGKTWGLGEVASAKTPEAVEEAGDVAAIGEFAKPYGARAIQVLVEIATGGDNESARVSACKELLDRGFGKVPQPVEGGGPGVTVVNVVTGVRGRD